MYTFKNIGTDHLKTVTLASEQTWVDAAKNKTGPAPINDVLRCGNHRVLGQEELPKQPVVVKAKFLNRKANKKVGGGRGDFGSLKSHGAKFTKFSQELEKKM